MSVMVTGNMLTRADLDALPDDGLRHELIDGTFVMSPSPGLQHQTVVPALAAVLRSALAGSNLRVLVAPFDVVLGSNVVVPDLVVAPRKGFSDRSHAGRAGPGPGSAIPLDPLAGRGAQAQPVPGVRRRVLLAD